MGLVCQAPSGISEVSGESSRKPLLQSQSTQLAELADDLGQLHAS